MVVPPGGGMVVPPGGGMVVPPGGGMVAPPGGGMVVPPGGGMVDPPGGGDMFPPGGGICAVATGRYSTHMTAATALESSRFFIFILVSLFGKAIGFLFRVLLLPDENNDAS
jgi:hypothetical protein